MNANTISFSAKARPDHRLFRNTPRVAPKIEKPPLETFAAALAHEIRNPLTNINLSVDMLEFAILDEDLKTYLGIIRRSSARINNQLKELLKYQQAEKVSVEKHSIEQLLDEIIGMSADRILLKQVVVRKEYDIRDCQVVFQRSKMKVALTNIIINALDAMPSEKGLLTLATRFIDGSYIVQIGDNGCGISPEHLTSIFKPYFTNKPDGLGLGLAATSDILRSNHVRVEVESEVGEGTLFTLVFEENM